MFCDQPLLCVLITLWFGIDGVWTPFVLWTREREKWMIVRVAETRLNASIWQWNVIWVLKGNNGTGLVQTCQLPLLRWLVWKSLEMCPFLVSMTRSKHAIEAKGNQTPLFVVCGVERRVTNGGRLCVCSMSKRINCTLCTYSLVEAVWSSCGFTPSERSSESLTVHHPPTIWRRKSAYQLMISVEKHVFSYLWFESVFLSYRFQPKLVAFWP